MISRKWFKRVHWFATFLALAGSICMAFRSPVAGHVCWVLANPLWVWWAVRRRDWATTLLFAVYEVIAVIGLVNWMLG